jgi:RimJ/RimL family protein N-acetyltransferase
LNPLQVTFDVRRPTQPIRVSESLRFREIDLGRDAETCIRFRADSFVESFGSADRFWQAAGEDAKDYLEGLTVKNRDWPRSCVHAWFDETIVGQIEVRRDRTDPARAHVLLYYLRPDMRGRGLAEQLDAYVLALCRTAGIQRTTLRVSPNNSRAIAFYRKQGWHDQGQDPEHPEVHVMNRVDQLV